MIAVSLFFVLLPQASVEPKIELLLPFQCPSRNSWMALVFRLGSDFSCPRTRCLHRSNHRLRPIHLRRPSPRLRPIPPPWHRVTFYRLRKLGVIANCTLLKAFRKTCEKTRKPAYRVEIASNKLPT